MDCQEFVTELSAHYPGCQITGVPGTWSFAIEETPRGGIRNVLTLSKAWAERTTVPRAVALLRGLPPSHVLVASEGQLAIDTSKFEPADSGRLAEYDERLQEWATWIAKKQEELDSIEKAIDAGATNDTFTNRMDGLKVSIRSFKQARSTLGELRRRAAAGLL